MTIALTVRCWGADQFGQLGDGTTTNSDVPRVVRHLSGVAQLAVGGSHACALLRDGQVDCWGYGYFGQLGDGSTRNALVPVRVVDL
jgi:alpha-tubulin suppressor-like RCC1 family protein